MKQGLAHTIALSSQQTMREEGYDRYVVWSVLVLMGAGVVAVYSAVSFMAMTKAGGNTELFLIKHLSHIAVALGAIFVFSRLDYHGLARFARLILMGVLVLLIGVEFYGSVYGGAARWIYIWKLSFQPSELARVALVIHVAHLLAKKQGYITSLKRAFVPILVWTLPTVLLIGKSDLSSAAMLLATIMLMCFVGRIRVLHLSVLAAGLLLAATVFLLFSSERAARLESYLGLKLFPNTKTEQVFDVQGEGYQTRQAQIAIASGGVLGVGPGKSVQRDFLPAPYNDFIFAIFAEEYGLVGALGILMLFLVLLFRGTLRIARDAPDDTGLFLALGITAMITIYGFVHAGVACGLLPVTGLPMPFVSYGGTSLLANGILVGILLNISRHRKTASPRAKRSREKKRR
jgi:cell division protein FtsW